MIRTSFIGKCRNITRNSEDMLPCFDKIRTPCDRIMSSLTKVKD